MNNSTLTKIVNYLIEGLIMFFLIVVWLFISCDDKNSSSIEYNGRDDTLMLLLFITSIGLLAVTWFLLKKRIAGIKTEDCTIASIVYAFIVGFTLYAIMDYESSYSGHSYEIDFSSFPLLWLIMEVAWLVIRYILNSTDIKKKK